MRDALRQAEGYLSLLRYRADTSSWTGGPVPSVADVDRVITLARAALSETENPKPSGRCAAAEALERILQRTGSPWVRQQARAVLASPCCVSAADQEQVKEALRWGRTEAAFIGNRQQVDKFSAALALLGSSFEEERES